MRSLIVAALAVLMLAACSSPSTQDNAFGEPSENLAFADGAGAIASALISDTLVADAAGARCAGERIAGQLSIDQLTHVQQQGTMGGLDLTSAEATKLVDALFDCTDPRDGVTVGLHSSGLDAVTAACIGESLSLETYAEAMIQSFTDGDAESMKPLAIDFDRATAACN